jgi:hypothetical protein
VWSETVNGMCARIFLKRSHVSNGTPILATYLVLRNVSDVANPMKLPWSDARLMFQVVDGAATEVPNWNGPYDGSVTIPVDLVLPYGSELSFDISHHGMGIPGDKGALIDLGSSDNWIIESDRGEFYLKARIEIDKPKQDRDGSMRVWHGRLELPPAVIPLTPEAIDASTLGKRIDQLGSRMLAPDSRVSRELSLIDDPRVIPWYVKAMHTDSYDLKFAALDRLSRFEGDEAFRGLKKGMSTQGADIGNCSTPEVAASSANNIRHSAANALARSPHPEAKRLLMSMASDPYSGVKISVLHSLGKMDTQESLELLKKMSRDSSESVRNEAVRYLKLRGVEPSKN